MAYVLVSTKYNEEFVAFMRELGGKWSAEVKSWRVPAECTEKVKAKAQELGIEVKITEETQGSSGQNGNGVNGNKANGVNGEKGKAEKGAIWMRRSKDGRFVLVSINLIAFAEDIKALMEGKRKSVRFKVLAAKNVNEKQQSPSQ
ncbi:MAG: hypothetical protein QW445_07410 [Candidatus Bathyarchaeia archaeon]